MPSFGMTAYNSINQPNVWGKKPLTQPASQPPQPNFNPGMPFNGMGQGVSMGVKPTPTPNWTMDAKQGDNITMGARQGPSMMADPVPDTQVSTAAPYSGGITYQENQPQNQNVQTNMPVTMGQPPTTQGNSFNTQYGTMDNLAPYMNPFLDSIIARGNRAIESSAAARHHLGSTGVNNQIGDWTGQAQANAFNDARNAFNADRGYMTDAYRDNRNFDYGAYQDANKWNYGLYRDQVNDYNNLMNGYQGQISGLSNTGYNAANQAGQLTQDQASALASLGLSQAQIQALAASAKGNNDSSAIDAGIKLLSNLFGG